MKTCDYRILSSNSLQDSCMWTNTHTKPKINCIPVLLAWYYANSVVRNTRASPPPCRSCGDVTAVWSLRCAGEFDVNESAQYSAPWNGSQLLTINQLHYSVLSLPASHISTSQPHHTVIIVINPLCHTASSYTWLQPSLTLPALEYLNVLTPCDCTYLLFSVHFGYLLNPIPVFVFAYTEKNWTTRSLDCSLSLSGCRLLLVFFSSFDFFESGQ